MPSLQFRNDNKFSQVGLGLGLGLTLCYLHDCHLCGLNVDSRGAKGAWQGMTLSGLIL